MNLAAILGVWVFSVGWLSCPSFGLVRHAEPAALLAFSIVHAQTNPALSGASPAGPSSLSGSQASGAQPGAAKSPDLQNSAKPVPASPKPRKRTKKTSYSNCSSAPAVLSPNPGSTGSARPASIHRSVSGSGISSTAKSDSGNSSKPSDASNSQPCPPRKKIVRNGGTGEPKIELEGGTPAQQASSARSTAEITAGTEENLKKLAERELSSSERQTVSQIRQFIEESRQAVAAGDPERAQDLATKARLLSEELLKP